MWHIVGRPVPFGLLASVGAVQAFQSSGRSKRDAAVCLRERYVLDFLPTRKRDNRLIGQLTRQIDKVPANGHLQKWPTKPASAGAACKPAAGQGVWACPAATSGRFRAQGVCRSRRAALGLAT
jgi:hypothetical protein